MKPLIYDVVVRHVYAASCAVGIRSTVLKRNAFLERLFNTLSCWRIMGVVVATALCGCSGTPMRSSLDGPVLGSQSLPVSTFPQNVQDELVRAKLSVDSLSVVIQRLDGAHPVIAHQAARANVPASVMKVVTTLAALELLGPTFRPTTKLMTTATQQGSTLVGDVILVGGGSVDFDHDGLRRMLMAVRQRGIDDIQGNLLLDRTLFAPERVDKDAPAFDESPEFGYNVIPDALTIRSNLLTYRVASDDHTVSVSVWPPLPGIRIRTALAVEDYPCRDWENRWKIPRVQQSIDAVDIEFHGAFPRNCTQTLQLNLIDPDIVLDRLFRTIWQELGGRFSGQTRPGKVSVGAHAPRVLAEDRGRTVGELVRTVNKSSDNVHARVLYQLLGVASRNGAESSSAASERMVRGCLRAKGIDDRHFVFENGSGLSRIEKIPTAQLVALLQQAAKSAWAPEFLASLPLAGLDGTLRNRIKGSAATGRARLKTGTLRDVVSVAGYVPDASGEIYVVVAFINDAGARNDIARPIVDALVEWVAQTDLSRLPTNHLK